MDNYLGLLTGGGDCPGLNAVVRAVVRRAVAREIQERTGLSTRATVLGYIQRGGSPTAYNRVLATRLGVHAVEMTMRGDYGRMASSSGTRITSVPLEEVADKRRPVDEEIFQTAEVFFG